MSVITVIEQNKRKREERNAQHSLPVQLLSLPLCSSAVDILTSTFCCDSFSVHTFNTSLIYFSSLGSFTTLLNMLIPVFHSILLLLAVALKI